MTKSRSTTLATAAFISFVALWVLASLTITQGAPPSPLVITRDADEPARHAFQTTVSIVIPHDDSAALGSVTIPAGKRLVAEFVSVHGNVLHGRTLLVQATTFGAVGEANHEIALKDPRRLGNDIYTASHAVRIYGEEGLTFRAVHSSAPAEPPLDSHISIGVSGYLVDMP